MAVRGWGYSPLEGWRRTVVTAAATARALVLAVATRRWAQQLVPFRLIVERNAEQAAPPVRMSRGASLRQNPNRALMPTAAVTTVLEKIEQTSQLHRGGSASMKGSLNRSRLFLLC